MLFLFLSLACSTLAVIVGLATYRENQSPYLQAAFALLTGAVAAAVFAAVAGQFAFFEFLDLLFGLFVGVTLAAGLYFLIRSLEDGNLDLPPTLLRVAMLLPIVLSVFFFDGLDTLSGLGAAGLAVSAVGVGLLVAGAWRRPDESAGRGGFGTGLVLAVFAIFFVGLQAFDAVVMSETGGGVFLTFLFGIAGLALLGLGLLRGNAITGPATLWGALSGLALAGAYVFLLLALARVPGWQGLGAVAAGHCGLAALAGLKFAPEPLRKPGLAGIAVALVGALLLLLA